MNSALVISLRNFEEHEVSEYFGKAMCYDNAAAAADVVATHGTKFLNSNEQDCVA